MKENNNSGASRMKQNIISTIGDVHSGIRVNFVAEFTEEWTSDTPVISQMGVLIDGGDEIRFVAFTRSGVGRMHVGGVYYIKNALVGVFEDKAHIELTADTPVISL